MIRTKRIYDPPAPEDGYRLLVMRLWPRGIPKEAVNGWERELGPSRELLEDWRRGRVPWEEFARRYRQEVLAKEQLVASVVRLARQGTTTILCSCTDDERCHRALLKGLVEKALRSPEGDGG